MSASDSGSRRARSMRRRAILLRRLYGLRSAAALATCCFPLSCAAALLQNEPGTAFPGAIGHGRNAQGGKGGKIIQVTTLSDSGPGSLRACIDAVGPRVCTFRVGGVIRYLTVRPIIRNPNITIAGETAPGGGIIITHAGGRGATTPFVIKNTHDVIVRHIRVRLDRAGEERRTDSAFIIEGSHDVILDHVSASWARDENIGGYGNTTNITISNSIFAEGVPRHDKCALLSSDPTKPQRVSFIGNICAHNGDRNPDINFMPGSCVEVVNNILYNANVQFSEVWESYGGTPVSIVNNYYRRGPSTVRLALALDRPRVASKGEAKIYFAGNIMDGHGLAIADIAKPVIVSTPPCQLTVAPKSAASAYPDALDQAGAFPRDAVDKRLVAEVRSRTGAIGRNNRFMPFIEPGEAYADSDRDGMSDSWEISQGLNPNVPDAWDDPDGNGWTNLQEFLDYAHRQIMQERQVK